MEGGSRSGGGARKEDKQVEISFVLSEALPAVPAKLVRRILRAEYVHMAELLRDNIEVEQRRGRGPTGPAASEGV